LDEEVTQAGFRLANASRISRLRVGKIRHIYQSLWQQSVVENRSSSKSARSGWCDPFARNRPSGRGMGGKERTLFFEAQEPDARKRARPVLKQRRGQRWPRRL